MKSLRHRCFIAVTSFAALAIPLSLAAQNAAKRHHHHQYHHYQIADPGTFGGPQSFQALGTLGAVGDLNNRGAFGAYADTLTVDPNCVDFPDCYAFHAFLWQNGAKTDLGLLPGGTNSQVNWISANGLTTGNGDNGQPDPLIGIPFQIRGTFWGHDRVITDIGALPGTYLAGPNAVNNRGEVVGEAMNTIPDSNSISGFGYQTRAFYWKDGVIQDLGTLGTGTDAVAFLINQRGQVVGVSYINAIPSAPDCAIPGYPLVTGSFIWDKKNGMKDLGGFGGTCTLAYDLNNRGQVVGASALPGDSIFHPFVWDAKTGITDLGTPDGGYGGASTLNENGDVVGLGEVNSIPNHVLLWRKRGGKWRITDLGKFVGGCPAPPSVNASVQVVGFDSCAGLPFLSEDGGPIVDLNTLVPSNSGLQLNEVGNINDRGEISINGNDVNHNNHSVVLIPCDDNHAGVEGCDYSLIDAETAAARSAQKAPQPPTSLTPGNRVPGMFNRFRSPLGRRTPGHGNMPPPSTILTLPDSPASSDWLGDHLSSAPQNGPSLYCEMANGVLTGGCVQTQGANTCQVTSNGCPKGLPEGGNGQITCGKNTIQLSVKCFSVPGFDLSSSALTPATVSAGGSATSTVTVSSYGSFGGTVVFTCSVQPSPSLAPTCSVSPSSVKSGTTTLTVSTTAPAAALLPRTGSGLSYALWLPLFGLVATGVGSRTTRKDEKANLIAAALVSMLFTGLVFQSACGGSSSAKPGTPAGAYTFTVTGQSGAVVSSTTTPLTVQ
jgi:probable HAF family extracellular repeat protein